MRKSLSNLLVGSAASVGTAALIVAAAALTSFGSQAATTSGHQPKTQPGENLGTADYGVCRGTDPRCYDDWGNFDPSTGYKVLLYTKTAGPRHADLGPSLGAGLDPALTSANVVQNAMIKLGQQNGFTVDWTEDDAQLASPAQLFKYNAVVFFSPSRSALDDPAQTSLRIYMEGGGGFVGIHNAFGTQYNWPWYEGLLGGAQLYDHGPAQAATVNVLDHRDASTSGLPSKFTFKDEWYNLVPFPSQVRILASVDEKSMAQAPKGYYGDPGDPISHPVTWCQYYDGGRSWVTTMGHDAGDFGTDATFPGATEFQQMIVGGIESVMGAKPFCR